MDTAAAFQRNPIGCVQKWKAKRMAEENILCCLLPRIGSPQPLLVLHLDGDQDASSCWIGAYTASTAASPEAPKIHHAWSHPNFWSLVGFVPTYYTLSFPLIVLLYYLLLSYHTYPFIIGPHTCTRSSPLSLNTLTRTCVSYCLTLIPYLATCLIYLQM